MPQRTTDQEATDALFMQLIATNDYDLFLAVAKGSPGPVTITKKPGISHTEVIQCLEAVIRRLREAELEELMGGPPQRGADA